MSRLMDQVYVAYEPREIMRLKWTDCGHFLLAPEPVSKRADRATHFLTDRKGLRAILGQNIIQQDETLKANTSSSSTWCSGPNGVSEPSHPRETERHLGACRPPQCRLTPKHDRVG